MAGLTKSSTWYIDEAWSLSDAKLTRFYTPVTGTERLRGIVKLKGDTLLDCAVVRCRRMLIVNVMCPIPSGVWTSRGAIPRLQ